MAQRSSSMSAILKAGSKATIPSPILQLTLLMCDAPGPEFVIKPATETFGDAARILVQLAG